MDMIKKNKQTNQKKQAIRDCALIIRGGLKNEGGIVQTCSLWEGFNI